MGHIGEEFDQLFDHALEAARNRLKPRDRQQADQRRRDQQNGGHGVGRDEPRIDLQTEQRHFVVLVQDAVAHNLFDAFARRARRPQHDDADKQRHDDGEPDGKKHDFFIFSLSVYGAFHTSSHLSTRHMNGTDLRQGGGAVRRAHRKTKTAGPCGSLLLRYYSTVFCNFQSTFRHFSRSVQKDTPSR